MENGRLEEKELYRQLDILKEMGFGGAFIHSRVGLETEYMGKEWMELIDKMSQKEKDWNYGYMMRTGGPQEQHNIIKEKKMERNLFAGSFHCVKI